MKDNVLKKEFKEKDVQRLRNIITPIEQRLSASDFVPNGVEVRVDIDDFLRGSALERAQVYGLGSIPQRRI